MTTAINDNHGAIDLADLNDKIKNNTPPTERDRDMLLFKLNKQLTEEEHLYIFTEILQTLSKRIYSITENCTLFDLNDLPNDSFWKIYLYAQLSIKDHERNKQNEIIKLEDENNQNELSKKMKTELSKFQNSDASTIPDNLSDLTPYERLRIGALTQCQYSTYSKYSNYNMAIHNDKQMEKTIYSDKYRWKTDADTIPVVKEPPKIQNVVDADSDSDDNDDDDLILSDSDGDDEIEEIELDKLKSHLLKNGGGISPMTPF